MRGAADEADRAGSRRTPRSPLRVGVDGVIYSYQSYGGITRMLDAVLPRLCASDPALELDVWTWSRLAHSIPHHPSIVRRRIRSLPAARRLRPAALGRPLRTGLAHANELLRRRAVNRSAANVWHATLYWRPRGWRGRVVVTVYDLKEEVFGGLESMDRSFLRSKRDAIENADHLLCISEATRRDLEEHYTIPTARVTVAPPAVDLEVFHPPDSSAPANWLPPFLLFVGRRDRFKNFDLLLAGLSHRASMGLDLVVVGPALTVSESRRIADLGLSARVRLLGGLAEAGLADLYRSAEALVYPSRYEGFGLPLLEAMACGCPVVASRIPSSLEVAEDAAVFFDPSSVESLIEAMETAVSEGRRSERIARGLATCRRYDWDSTAAATMRVYRQVAA